ncbi:enoyl-CoA hydratase/isomerase family protein [Ponticoccus alexandrii]|uniref:Enoyl-CoA hydratase/isomerase family protein n=1 Tax=Ponticoccus alexandrii TaxID=1943633 RepID=A0ABX7FH53_9RHOB|nr:enoyl-CoA hydratase/isomerase family protein [Ponticoccus alexandrii]ETA49446.1 enoyl-CoA hydratase [Rhodobacteraceae bacterium PD-2]QRF69359.1 enoyl-CoA hydratase/isomerase family protein [Ponticoccus alexandrii]
MDFISSETRNGIGIITLNRPQVLNAWNARMRDELIEALDIFEADAAIGAIVLTGAGDRAFGAGQDFNEAKDFDPKRAEIWVEEWEKLYHRVRTLSKPIVAALNGSAVGSAFQLTLLCDLRIGHKDVLMGQPEILSGIASTTGPWIMKEIIGLARTIDLTLTGRLLEADECERIGLISRMVPKSEVLSKSLEIAAELASRPKTAMRLNRQRFAEMTEPGFRDSLEAGVRIQREAYGSGEPRAMMEIFLAERARRKAATA